MSTSAREAYQARLKRVEDAISLRRPDRVPVAFCHCQYYMTRAVGMSNKEAMLDHKRRFDAWRDMTIHLNLDLAIHPFVLPAAQALTILGAEQYKWPGGELPDNVPFQYVEKEYVRAEEYDAFLANPGDFTVRRLWPRLATGLQPLSLLPPLHLFSNIRILSDMLGPILGTPPFADLLQRLIDVGRVAAEFATEMFSYIAEMEKLGFPVGYASVAEAPFDYVANHLRGMRGALLDMYRNPEKLLAAIEFLTPMVIRNAILLAKNSGSNRVYMPLHRGSAGFMSDEQFARFYWPSLKRVLTGLIDTGHTPMVYFEGDYTPRLKYLAELPRAKIAGHFEVVDRKEVKRLIGDTMCFWGNVPARMLITGTPDQVRDDVKELIDTFADNGGLIVDSSMGLPDEAKPENVHAMIETVFTYGVH
jgi:hypothetical protein